MKTVFMTLVGIFFLSAPALAETHEVEQCENQISEEVAPEDAEARADWSGEYYGVWHCTAYPNHSGHGHGHDAYDRHYSHAYRRALRSCQYYHYHCHVHCHYDHHH